jgi:hypothetical protein
MNRLGDPTVPVVICLFCALILINSRPGPFW